MDRRTLDRLLSSAGLVVAIVMAIGGVLAWVGSNYANEQVRNQLVQEKVFFPEEVEYEDIQQYAGEQVDTGQEAKVYADQYIWRHMMAASGGKTYAEVSAEAMANPDDPQLEQVRQTLFMGDMLRSSLLTAYAFGQIGQVAFWAAIVLWVGAAVLLILALLGYRHANRVAAASTQPRAPSANEARV